MHETEPIQVQADEAAKTQENQLNTLSSLLLDPESALTNSSQILEIIKSTPALLSNDDLLEIIFLPLNSKILTLILELLQDDTTFNIITEKFINSTKEKKAKIIKNLYNLSSSANQNLKDLVFLFVSLDDTYCIRCSDKTDGINLQLQFYLRRKDFNFSCICNRTTTNEINISAKDSLPKKIIKIQNFLTQNMAVNPLQLISITETVKSVLQQKTKFCYNLLFCNLSLISLFFGMKSLFDVLCDLVDFYFYGFDFGFNDYLCEFKDDDLKLLGDCLIVYLREIKLEKCFACLRFILVLKENGNNVGLLLTAMTEKQVMENVVANLQRASEDNLNLFHDFIIAFSNNTDTTLPRVNIISDEIKQELVKYLFSAIKNKDISTKSAALVNITTIIINCNTTLPLLFNESLFYLFTICVYDLIKSNKSDVIGLDELCTGMDANAFDNCENREKIEFSKSCLKLLTKLYKLRLYSEVNFTDLTNILFNIYMFDYEFIEPFVGFCNVVLESKGDMNVGDEKDGNDEIELVRLFVGYLSNKFVVENEKCIR